MIWPLPSEQAILTIGGQDFRDWETISVKQQLEIFPFYSFRFTCSEDAPIAKNFRALQIRPGDFATITLAGQLAFTGLVFSRQVLYDATKHYIEIQGAAKTLELVYAHVVHQTMEQNNKTAKEMIDELVKPHNIKFWVTGGQLPTDKIPRHSIAPGTTVADAIETILRQTGGTQLTSNVNGDLVAVVSTTKGGTQGTVTEGVDILEGREIIYNVDMYQGTYVQTQKQGADEGSASKWTHEPHEKSPLDSQIEQPIKQVISSEIPGYTKDMLIHRGNMDQQFQKRDQVTVFITVQGWLRPGGGLWESCGQAGNVMVSVVSPMLILNGSEELFTKSVTFTQDNNGGTRTILELTNANAWYPSIAQTGGQKP